MGDDGVGPFIARGFHSKGWISIDCGVAPENFTSIIKEHKPQYVVIVDAAEMGLAPGEYRRISISHADTCYISTHTIPISALLSYLKEYCKEIILIGIQPKSLDLGSEISPEVREGANKLIADLKDFRSERIPFLDP